MRFKKSLIITLILAGLAGKANSGILYSSNQKNQDSKTKIQQNIRLEEIIEKTKQKYPKKELKYFSRGFLQFQIKDKELEFIQDKEINNLIQKLNKDSNDSNSIEAINFYDNYTIIIDPEPHHLGDGRKEWYPVKKEPEGNVYEKKFNIKDIKAMENPRLSLEAFSSDSDNKIYLNEKLIGFVPKMSKKRWKAIIKRYKEKTPFIHGELSVAKYLKQGENTIRIESEKPKGLFKTYDDFIIGNLQVVYNKSDRNKQDKNKK